MDKLIKTLESTSVTFETIDGETVKVLRVCDRRFVELLLQEKGIDHFKLINSPSVSLYFSVEDERGEGTITRLRSELCKRGKVLSFNQKDDSASRRQQYQQKHKNSESWALSIDFMDRDDLKILLNETHMEFSILNPTISLNDPSNPRPYKIDPRLSRMLLTSLKNESTRSSREQEEEEILFSKKRIFAHMILAIVIVILLYYFSLEIRSIMQLFSNL